MIEGKSWDLREWARRLFPSVKTETLYDLSRHTTIGCGGRAALAVFPRSEREALELSAACERDNVPNFVLGAGANVLPSDSDFWGVVFRLGFLNAVSAQGSLLTVGAGTTGGALLRFAASRNLGGLEPFTGIPMTVGGGVAMNAGIRARHFSDVVEEVVAVDRGKRIILTARECGFSEKNSVFLQGITVLSVKIRAVESSPENIGKERNYFRLRRSHLPKGRSMGCTFVNPPQISAGALIDRCGLKGLRIGGAHVSTAHANFILNDGGSASDVAALIDKVKYEVQRQTGVVLREEIRRLPPQKP